LTPRWKNRSAVISKYFLLGNIYLSAGHISIVFTINNKQDFAIANANSARKWIDCGAASQASDHLAMVEMIVYGTV